MRRALLLAALLLPQPAAAGSGCSSADGVIAAIECLRGEYDSAKREIDRIWPLVLERFPSGGDRDEHRALIRASQTAWIAFRDAECAARDRIGIPRYWGYNRLACLVEMTRARIAALTATYLP